jgi:phosphoribosyl 1,2-cyclic phosphodiesterase
MIFRSLASSSAGNAYVVSDGETRVLLECGLPPKKLMKLVGGPLTDFKAVLVTHEHKDHAKAALDLIAKGMEVYMSAGTAEALETDLSKTVEHMQQFNVGSLDIVPFTTFHDASEPLGFLIRSRVDGEVLAFATDTVNLRYRFPGLNILAIEANYTAEVLDRCEKLPEKVRHRITNTHMEIDTLCDYLKTLDLSKCREIHLLHLSDSTSREEEFLYKVRMVVPRGIVVKACPK